MIVNSIKWRLQLWHGFLLVCLLSGMMAGFYAYERRSIMQAVDNQLLEAMPPMMPKLMPRPWGWPSRGHDRERWRTPRPEDSPGTPETPPNSPPNFSGPPMNMPPQVYYAAWTEDGTPIIVATNAPADLPKPSETKDGRLFRTRQQYREFLITGHTGRVILVGKEITQAMEHLRHLALALAGIGAGIVAAGLAVGWWLATRALHPIEAMSQTAREIAAGDLSRRINMPETESELGQLAGVLNSTFARLEGAFAQQRQFTSDAAHELRTPVSVILTQVQSTLKKERHPDEYRETLEACQRAAQRMRRLIECLLELARWDAGQEALQSKPCDLGQVAANSLELVRPLAEERGIDLSAELKEAPCLGDPERLGQVLTNLMTNAVLHNRSGKKVRVLTGRHNGSVYTAVVDDGPGIPAEDLPHIFERFYRADKSRSGSTGGTGLGLAISKTIVEAHGGNIEVSSRVGAGSEFKINLPGTA